jgi:hypothetical protein
MESKDLEVVTSKTLTAIDIRKQVNLIKEVMNEVMQEGQHYGKIPGCGDKPTLLKPGAEKLSLVFKLRPIMNNNGDIIIEKLDNGHREVTIYCHILNQSGEELATGIGSCSTMESKFRYRGGEKISTGKTVPTEYWNLKKEGKNKEAQELIGGKSFGVAKIDGSWQICKIGEKMENPDIADTWNTVLKMSKKRAYVDGILSATAASDIFTQDIEDLPTEMLDNGVTKSSKPTVAMPQEKQPVTQKPQEQEIAEDTLDAQEVNKELNVLEALEQPDGAIFDMWGLLHDFKSRKVKTAKGLSDITDYQLSPRDSTQLITVSKFGKAHEGISNSDTILLRGVKAKIFKDIMGYLAHEIEILKKGEENAGE